ncbi:MAG: AraC family transcriptional regulator [Ruminococcaceae bacterium]|nr:AraC family transcriptional regulator [Oscillospiraceae bacterium]
MRYRVFSIGELSVLKIHNFGYSSDIIGSTFAERKNEFYLIGYVLSGKGIYNNHPISAGQGFIFTPNVVENLYPDKADPLELVWFTTADSRIDELLPYYKADKYTNIFNHSFPPELQDIKEFAVSENRTTISDGKMLELFFSVFKHHLIEHDFAASSLTAPQRYIDFSVNYIKTHYSQHISVTRLTELLGVSQPYLYRIFKEAFGKSPKAFICEYRINRASKLLTETDLPVSEIALSVGYSDSFAFSKAFSSIRGLSPSEYRNMHKATANP